MIRNQDYKVFSQKIHNLARKKCFPLRAMFELTYRCNFKCIHCYNTDEQKGTRPEDELKTKEIFNILEQLRNLGCFYLGFTGGEIFMRKDILDIISYARRLGFEVILLTNASLIDEDIADKLKELMPNKVDITVHAINHDTFDEITRIPGSSNKVFKAIDLLYKRNIPLGLKSCGMQQNRDEIVKISRFARKLNAIYRFDGELIPRQDRSKIPLKYSISSQEVYSLRKACYPEMFTKYDEKGRFKKTVLRRRFLKKLFNCGAGLTNLTINPYGELKICIEIDYPRYNILKGSLVKGWQQIKDLVDKLKPPKDWSCKYCEFLKYCSWCPAKSWLENGDFSTCDSYSRKQAEFTKQVYEK